MQLSNSNSNEKLYSKLVNFAMFTTCALSTSMWLINATDRNRPQRATTDALQVFHNAAKPQLTATEADDYICILYQLLSILCPGGEC